MVFFLNSPFLSLTNFTSSTHSTFLQYLGLLQAFWSYLKSPQLTNHPKLTIGYLNLTYIKQIRPNIYPNCPKPMLTKPGYFKWPKLAKTYLNIPHLIQSYLYGTKFHSRSTISLKTRRIKVYKHWETLGLSVNLENLLKMLNSLHYFTELVPLEWPLKCKYLIKYHSNWKIIQISMWNLVW